HRSGQFQLRIETAERVYLRSAFRNLVALRILQSVRDCVACARAGHSDIAEFCAADFANPTLDVNLFARTIHLAVVEDEPAQRINGISLVPACSTAPPIVMLRQDCNVSPRSRNEQA